MSTKVETRETMAQPLQAVAESSIVPERNTPTEIHEDQSKAKHTQAKREASPEERSSKQASSSLSAKARKRTKTGCLTCRRRRIKCGEERPTCNNCVKSKRNCEGYTPRVIFKDPLGARPTGCTVRDTGSQFQSITSYNIPEAHHRLLQPRNDQMPLPVIAPHPTQQEQQMWPGMKPFGMMPPYSDRPYDTSVYTPSDLPPHVLQKIVQRNCPLDTSPETPEIDTFAMHHPRFSTQYHPRHHAARDSGLDVTYPEFRSEWSHSSNSSTTMPTTFVQAQTNQQLSNHEPQHSQHQDPAYAYALFEVPFQPPATAFQQETWRTSKLEHEPSQVSTVSQDCYDPNQAMPTMKYTSSCDQAAPQGYAHLNENGVNPLVISRHSDTTPPNTQANRYDPTAAALYDPSPDDADDDYFDVDSDEDQGDQNHNMSEATRSNLGLMLAVSASQTDVGVRSFTSFLNERNILSSYRPPYSASPLMDPQTARIFCHFVTATAPTLSLHNRHPVNPSVMFTGAPVPAFQRSLFTYTLPMMALSNQALLHAQLALASLHIAKLQQTSATPSLKHYHYALRRVAKAVGHPTKRREIATLAATLLLGFFEVTTAEHNKWNSHLAGARELILEIDFAGMTKRINAYKAETSTIKKGGPYDYGQNQHYSSHRRMSFDILRTDKEIDENLVSTLMGYRTRYDEYGQVIDANDTPSNYHIPLTPEDVEKFEIQCDLFWWYARQDMYQSLISGNRLLLSYARWSHCPPRGPVGRLDAVYGSVDHLILVFARLTEFSARDRARKIKAQAKAEEDISRSVVQEPPSWSPGQFTQPVSNNRPPTHGAPPMYGMMPAPGRIHLPSAFSQSRHDYLNEANKIIVEDAELEAATYAAEREWSEIWSALDVLEQAFGFDYQPLSPDHMTPLSTPFGPALYYRTYSIACLWSLFYTARIYATRVAPGMPPAAMAATGVAAPRTAQWANTIGRICGGLQPVSVTAPLNPSHGAALMDSCMGLFHAGIQYRDAAQRGWTITKLRNIARLTGWQTSALIASGCERAWMAAADMGKGPPYVRTMNATAKDDRVSGRSRDANLGPPKDNNDRRFITVNPGTRVYWALGILGAEEDMKQLKLD
ncbi:MAG: hypothetical protein Q9226_003941 [Calogaya cf. arnoldii]